MGAALSEVRRGLDQEEGKFQSPRVREGLHLFLILGPIIPRKDLEGESEHEVPRCIESPPVPSIWERSTSKELSSPGLGSQSFKADKHDISASQTRVCVTQQRSCKKELRVQ